MADSGTGFELKPHEETYSGFLGLLKWGLIATILVVALVIFLIAG